jgi:hypothetical protein
VDASVFAWNPQIQRFNLGSVIPKNSAPHRNPANARRAACQFAGIFETGFLRKCWTEGSSSI